MWWLHWGHSYIVSSLRAQQTLSVEWMNIQANGNEDVSLHRVVLPCQPAWEGRGQSDSESPCPREGAASTHSSNSCHGEMQAQHNSCSIFSKESGDLDLWGNNPISKHWLIKNLKSKKQETIHTNKLGLPFMMSDHSKLSQDRPAQVLPRTWELVTAWKAPSIRVMQTSSVQKTEYLKYSLTLLFWWFALWLENSWGLKTYHP